MRAHQKQIHIETRLVYFRAYMITSWFLATHTLVHARTPSRKKRPRIHPTTRQCRRKSEPLARALHKQTRTERDTHPHAQARTLSGKRNGRACTPDQALQWGWSSSVQRGGRTHTSRQHGNNGQARTERDTHTHAHPRTHTSRKRKTAHPYPTRRCSGGGAASSMPCTQQRGARTHSNSRGRTRARSRNRPKSPQCRQKPHFGTCGAGSRGGCA